MNDPEHVDPTDSAGWPDTITETVEDPAVDHDTWDGDGWADGPYGYDEEDYEWVELR